MYLVHGTEYDRSPNHEHTHFRLYDVESILQVYDVTHNLTRHNYWCAVTWQYWQCCDLCSCDCTRSSNNYTIDINSLYMFTSVYQPQSASTLQFHSRHHVWLLCIWVLVTIYSIHPIPHVRAMPLSTTMKSTKLLEKFGSARLRRRRGFTRRGRRRTSSATFRYSFCGAKYAVSTVVCAVCVAV